MPSPSKWLEQFHVALLDAFPTRETLEQMVRFGLDQRLDEIVGSSSGLSEASFRLLQHVESHGLLHELLKVARERNPRNPLLRDLPEIERDPMSVVAALPKWTGREPRDDIRI